MKTKFIFHMLLMTAVVFLASCVKEGPAGLAGADGKDGIDGVDGANGQDGTVTCLACHSGSKIASRQFQYGTSQHKSGSISLDYAGGRASCARCHSGNGYQEFIANGTVAADMTPEAINCETCHNLHSTFTYADFGFRGGVTVNLITGGTFNKTDGSDVCANCHQARTAPPVADANGNFRISSTHYGPHHNPAANLFAGIGFAEIAGAHAYPTPGSTAHTTQASCVKCHMGEYNAASNEGGHTWNPSLNACNTCHETASFDYGGKQTTTFAQLEELRDLLITAGVVAGNDTDGYYPVTGTHPLVYTQAFFNWIGIEEDRSEGVHNPKYITALLLNSIEAVEAKLAEK